MGKFKLAFGIHNHQPVGNFTSVFEEAHRDAYLPFLKLLSEHEDIRISLHQSGILWDWQQKNHPDYLDLVRQMVDRGQIELMTGGFYEPILIAVPERDARGQLEMLNRFLADRFGVKPVGLWLTERIWEPHLPKLLARCGVKYLPIDDTHFIYSGFEQSQLTGPFVTEDEGHKVTLLPIQKKLRYLIPFGMVDTVIDELRRQAEKNPSGMAVYADDGEKFGVWPNTHQHCYHDGWLERFFTAVEKNADWLEIVPLARAAEARPVGRAYLPSASYEEMLQWSLPTKAYMEYEQFEKWLAESGNKDRFGRFVRGGHWRGFLVKYDEANLMHKKMLRVSRELAAFEEAENRPEAAITAIRDRLYAAQCNCPYWHGVFGGLYLPHIRQAVYDGMIDAHRMIREMSGRTGVSMDSCDYDMDGIEEIIADSDEYTAVFAPNRGGHLVELSLNRHGFNLTDTMSRRKEGYHAKLTRAVSSTTNGSHASIHDQILTKESGLEKILVEDTYLKRCLIDHFFGHDVEFGDFEAGKAVEQGDFIHGQYGTETDASGQRLQLTHDGSIPGPGGMVPIHLSKEVVFEPGVEKLQVIYCLSCPSPGGVDVNFGVENNFNFQAGHAPDRYLLVDNRRPAEAYLDSVGSHEQVGGVALVDEYRSLAVGLSTDRPADIWYLPIFTVSLSEGGFEKVYQGTTLIHRFRLHLDDQPVRIHFNLLAGAMSGVLDGTFSMAAAGR